VDLVAAGWVACLATLVLDDLRRVSRPGSVLLLGAAAGLAELAKSTTVLATGPLLAIWLVAQARTGAGRCLLRRLGPATAGGLAVLAVAGAICVPYLYRVYVAYGNIAGPAYLRDEIGMQRHDPASVLVNALRIGQSALEIPAAPVNDAAAEGIGHLSRAVGVDPNDPMITYWGARFPTATWAPNEDKASYPIEGVLALLAGCAMLVRPARRRGVIRLYAAACWLGLLLYVATVKWQPWGSRLTLFLLVLAMPLVGLWLEVLLPARAATASPVPAGRPAPRTRLAAWAVLACLCGAVLAGALSVGYGWPRRLVGHGSVFTQDRMAARFHWRPQLRGEYEWAAAAIRASGARRVGLIQGYNSWEYPWWVLLPGDDIVALQSSVPGHPPAGGASVDAIACTSGAGACHYYSPRGWRVYTRDGIGSALPPSVHSGPTGLNGTG
jgi:hypothetical protein